MAVTIGVLAIAIASYTARSTPGAAGVSPPAPIEAGAGRIIEAMRPLMGTQFNVKVWAHPGRERAAAAAINVALESAAELDQQINAWHPDSETAKINDAAGQTAVAIGADLRDLLAISMRWARRTGGAFDVTGGPLFDLWRDAREQNALPSDAAIGERLALVGYDLIEVHEEAVRLRLAGMKLGFESVRKGFAADRAAARLRADGFSDFIVDAGGDLVFSGSRGGIPWSLGIRHPRSNELFATARLTCCAIATSGDYEQYVVIDGERFGHIIDPRSGWPVRAVTSVVAIAPTGADADALATGLFALGPEKGLELVEKISSVEALFMMKGGAMHLSSGLSLKDNVLERIK